MGKECPENLYLTQLFQSTGFDTIGPVTSPKEVAELLGSASPPIADLDGDLELEWVVALARTLRQKGIPVVLVSSGESILDCDEAVARTVAVPKPVDSEVLRKALFDTVASLLS